MSVLDDITSGWGSKKAPGTQDVNPTQPPQAGSVAKQVVREYDASLNNPVDNNATVKGIVPTVNADGTVNVAENKPVYNVKDDPVSKYRIAPKKAPDPVAPAVPVVPKQEPYKSTVDSFINNYTPESTEQKEQREKRERRNKIFTSVADGIGALANIVGGVNGAKNANPNNVSLTKAYQNRLDQFKQARKENEQKYLYYMQKKDEAKRQADAAAFDKDKFDKEYNLKVDEIIRDQCNKDWEHNHAVEQDKIMAALKAKGIKISEDTLAELIRSHRASEGIAQKNATTNQQRANIESSKENVDRTWAEVYNKHPQEAGDFERKYNIGVSGSMHAPTAWTQEQKKTFIALMRINNTPSHSSSKSKIDIEQFKVNHGKKTKNPPLN